MTTPELPADLVEKVARAWNAWWASVSTGANDKHMQVAFTAGYEAALAAIDLPARIQQAKDEARREQVCPHGIRWPWQCYECDQIAQPIATGGSTPPVPEEGQHDKPRHCRGEPNLAPDETGSGDPAGGGGLTAPSAANSSQAIRARKGQP